MHNISEIGNYDELLVDMWFPSRTDVENCPLDFFNVKYVYQLEPEKFLAGAKLRAGSSSESCLVDILKGKPEKEAREHWKEVLSLHHPIHERDKLQLRICLEEFNDVVTHLLGALKQLNQEPIDDQLLVKDHAKGLDMAIGGYIDLDTKNNFIEIKTQWSTAMPVLKKDGTISTRKPSKLSNPRTFHIRQVATYSYACKKLPIVINANAFDYTIFDSNNCEYLQKKPLKMAFETMRLSARARQNLLKISTDPRVLAEHIPPPNFSHYVYNDFNNETLQEIKQIWGYEE